VVKIPRFTFEKFSSADPMLTVSMKSVGEVMSIGRTFKEALQKALRSLEIGKSGFNSMLFKDLEDIKTDNSILDKIKDKLRVPNAERIFYIADALRAGIDAEQIYSLTNIDPWFLQNIKEIIGLEIQIIKNKSSLSKELLASAKEFGFSDCQLALLTGKSEDDIYALRKSLKITPVFKLVDTCAAEFRAHTPYFYSTYDH
jgi:carbamoyl-phosphate synthase large subunit